MFYYIPLDNKYIASMNGETITSISIIADWQTIPEIINIDLDDNIRYHINKNIKKGTNRGFFTINELLEYAIAQGDDLSDKLPDRPRKRIIGYGDREVVDFGATPSVLPIRTETF